MKNLKRMTSGLLVTLMLLMTMIMPAAAATTILISNGDITDESTVLPIVFTITNDGATAVTDTLTVTVTDTDGLITGSVPTTANTVVQAQTFTVAAGTTEEVTYNVAIVGGNANTAYTVGVSAAGTTGNLGAGPFTATLEVTPSDASPSEVVDGLVDNVDVERNYAPGDSVTVEVGLDNSLATSADFTDVSVEAWITDASGDRVEDRQDSSEFNLNNDEEETLSFTFGLPSDADEGIYTIHLSVDSDQGVLDLDSSETFDVERADHSLYFNSVAFDSTANAGESVDFAVSLYNNGLNDEDNVRTSVTVSGVGVSQTSGNYVVEEDQDTIRYFTLSLPSTMGTGTYQITLHAWNGDVDVSETYDLVVAGVAAPAEAPEEADDSASIITTTVVSDSSSALLGSQWPVVAVLLAVLVLWVLRREAPVRTTTRRGRKKKDVYY